MSASKFEFEVNKKKYSLPHFADLPTGAVRKSRKADDPMDQAFTLIEAVADEETLAAIDSMSSKDFGQMIGDWAQGSTPGESSDS